MKRLLNLDLNFIIVGVLCLVLLFGPLLRGLFFAPETLYTQMVVAGAFILALANSFIRREPPALLRSFTDRLALGLVVVAGSSIAVAVEVRGAVLGALEMLMYFFVYWVAARVTRSVAGAALWLGPVALGGGAVALVGLGVAAGAVTFQGGLVSGRIMSTFQYPNATAAYLMVASLAALGLWVGARNFLLRALWGVVTAACLLAILGTLSRGVWIVYPLAAVVFLAGLPAGRRGQAAFNVGLAIVLALLAARPSFGAPLPNPSILPATATVAGVVALVEAVRLVAAGWVARQTPLTRAFLAWGAGAYMVAVVLFYVGYTASALPAGFRETVPAIVAQRAESIGGTAPSFVDRMEFNRDALRIVADHPLLGAGSGGWNALYHRYQRELYWSSEVHNGFLQLWVEWGTLGLILFLGVWVLFVRSLALLWRRRGQEGWPAIWAAGVAALALGVHSLFDFDLSYPAMAITLWTLIGAVAGAGASVASGATGSGRSAEQAAPAGRRRLRPALAGGLALAVLLFWPSLNLFRAGRIGAEGALALARGDYALARALFDRARALDPLTGSYTLDRAQAELALALQGQGGSRETVERLMDEATRYQPADLFLHMKLANLAMTAGNLERVVGETEKVLELLPRAAAAYEGAGRAYIAAARLRLQAGKVDEARVYLDRAALLPALQEERAAPVTPLVRLIAGQAAYLRGDDATAVSLLAEAAGLKGLPAGARTEAGVWLAAAHDRAGDREEGARLLRNAAGDDSAWHAEFRLLLSLRP